MLDHPFPEPIRVVEIGRSTYASHVHAHATVVPAIYLHNMCTTLHTHQGHYSKTRRQRKLLARSSTTIVALGAIDRVPSLRPHHLLSRLRESGSERVVIMYSMLSEARDD
jgi:hypothetical protein